jgi:hypothetical protein
MKERMSADDNRHINPAFSKNSVMKNFGQSRGSNSKEQMGNQNQIESTRINKNYPDKITKAEAKPNPKGSQKQNESTGPRIDQRAGGSKNKSTREMGSSKYKNLHAGQ